MADDYTPTTAEVRFAMAGLRMSHDRFVTGTSFDAWLARHDAEVAERIAAAIELAAPFEANPEMMPAAYTEAARIARTA